MISDGYNRSIRLSDGIRQINVVYRPATFDERRMFRHLIRKLGDVGASRVLYQWIGEHVVMSDIPPARTTTEQMSSFDKAFPALFATLRQAVQGIVVDSSGEAWASIEAAWARNLYEGVILARTNNKLANRSCDDCQKHWFNETTGEKILSNSTGLPLLRQGPTLCQTETGCPKGTPDKQKSLNRANKWALKHYRECETSSFPVDDIVARNSFIISKAMKAKIDK